MATILVVDDEPDIRELLTRSLERDGHQVLTASDGAAALRTMERVLPDLVLLDLAMPELDGWAVLTTIKAGDTPVSRVPVVVLTAHASPDTRIRGSIEGAIRTLPKPFSLDDLRHEVRHALEGGPEPAQRRRAQAAALEQLARRERLARSVSGSGSGSEAGPRPVRLHLTRLERPRPRPADPARTDVSSPLERLTERQREVLDQLARSASVSAAAEELGVSRSNVYASLRRVARRLEVSSVSEVVAMARGGDLLDGSGH